MANLPQAENLYKPCGETATPLRKDTKKMNEYLYEIRGAESGTSDLSDEEMIYVQAYSKVHTNRKNKIQKENIYNEGICHSIYGSESETASQRGFYHI